MTLWTPDLDLARWWARKAYDRGITLPTAANCIVEQLCMDRDFATIGQQEAIEAAVIDTYNRERWREVVR